MSRSDKYLSLTRPTMAVIETWRKEKMGTGAGFSQVEVAHKASIGASNYAKLRNGTRKLQFWQRDNLLAALGRTPLDLHRELIAQGYRVYPELPPLAPRELLQPHPDAEAHARSKGERGEVCDYCVEVFPHPALACVRDLTRVGWLPQQVPLIDTREDFDASRALRAVGKEQPEVFSTVSRIKYCLSDVPRRPLLDDDSLHLFVSRTDYNTVMSVLYKDPPSQAELKRCNSLGIAPPEDASVLQSRPDIRRKLAAFEPSENCVPNALCLHLIVRFADGDLLCLLRRADIAYYPKYWSFSVEEQLDVVDFEYGAESVLHALFKRALFEEVFPMRSEDPSTLRERWDEVTRLGLVQLMRLWSVGLSEDIASWCLFGFVQLTHTSSEFQSWQASYRHDKWSKEDNEGTMAIASEDSVYELLTTGTCIVSNMVNNDPVIIAAERLHPTSRYRLLRLLSAVGRPLFAKA